MPLLEKGQRQPQQMVEQARAHLEVQRVLHTRMTSERERSGGDR